MATGSLFGDDEPAPTGEGGGHAALPPDSPLAARMRPRSLEEFAGQEHLLGPGKALRRAIEEDRLRSAVFWGPPGCGKSTLAAVIACHTRAHFESFSAVLSGIPEVRRAIEAARQRRRSSGRRTILFVDEIHRFNKAQQDALLPHVEDGTVVLIGATTENPFFEVNTPLLSRAVLYRFEPLDDAAVTAVLERALSDSERGLGTVRAILEPEALHHLVRVAGGDARAALNALEAAVAAAASRCAPPESPRVTLALAEEGAQQPALAYDRDGDQHYDVVSAFIKSLRGSDPDAAVYWLHRMLAAGEDPRFICRRLLVHAAEDVGMADPTALLIASAAAHALELVGLPEAAIPMTQAAIHIATAPKSNSVIRAMGAVRRDLAAGAQGPVPIHLRDAHYRGAARLGHGKGYRYPHDSPAGHVPQTYLPDGLPSEPYYVPTAHGYEREIAERLRLWRERPAEGLRGEQGEDPS